MVAHRTRYGEISAPTPQSCRNQDQAASPDRSPAMQSTENTSKKPVFSDEGSATATVGLRSAEEGWEERDPVRPA